MKKFKNIKKHYIISEIVEELYKQKFKIISFNKSKKISSYKKKK